MSDCCCTCHGTHARAADGLLCGNCGQAFCRTCFKLMENECYLCNEPENYKTDRTERVMLNVVKDWAESD